MEAEGGEPLLGRLNVVAERLGFVLHLHEPVLDHVSDRHDADESLLLNHRDMAEFACRHPLHDGTDSLRLTAGGHLARHDQR